MAVTPYRAKRMYLSLSEAEFAQALATAYATQSVRFCGAALVVLLSVIMFIPIVPLVALAHADVQVPLSIRLAMAVTAPIAFILWTRWAIGRFSHIYSRLVSRRAILCMLKHIQKQSRC
jgi:hypothetical protein